MPIHRTVVTTARPFLITGVITGQDVCTEPWQHQEFISSNIAIFTKNYAFDFTLSIRNGRVILAGNFQGTEVNVSVALRDIQGLTLDEGYSQKSCEVTPNGVLCYMDIKADRNDAFRGRRIHSSRQ